MKKKSIIAIIASIVIIGIVFIKNIIDFIIDVMWFKEVGYTSVFFKGFTTGLSILIPTFILIYLFIWLYYRSIRKKLNSMKTIKEIHVGNKKIEKRIFCLSNIFISLIISFEFAKSYWYKLLEFMNASKFNVSDPIFDLDLSIFMFKLPLIQSLHRSISSLVIMLFIITIIIFFTLGSKEIFLGNIKNINELNKNKIFNLSSKLTKFAGKQLAVLSFILLVLFGVQYLIDALELVYSPRGLVFGASYTDTKITLKFNIVIAVVCFISSIIVMISIIKSKFKPIVISILPIAILIFGEIITAGLVQRFVVDSNTISFEKPFIENNIKFTRKAFNLDTINEFKFEPNNDLTKGDVEDNIDIIKNIKINSFVPTLEFYNQVQYIKKYYSFNDIDIDRYLIDGDYTQVFIAPREIDPNALEQNSNMWQNNHLIYTHGYGVVMNKVNSVTKSGQPDFVIDGIPYDNKTDIKLNNPRIYFGENTDKYVIVNTKRAELDYPEGDTNVSYKYSGKAGINMSLLNKIIFAIKENNAKFLLSRDITSDSKVLIRRNIMDRVERIAPFLYYDNDPYVIIDEGHLKWIVDAYTVSNKYPFSKPLAKSNINYIRNSVKVVVDAFDGSVDFYLVDETDPIAKTYDKIFPKLFKDKKHIPENIKKHFRYPSDLYRIQCEVLGEYHVTNPEIFIKDEDPWDIAKDKYKVEENERVTEPNYVVMKLPGEEEVEMVLLEYFNVKDRDNMVAILAARMDGDNYGKITMFKFPVKETIYSPALFLKRINQDTEISKAISLLNQQGSQIVYGDTLIIPIKNSLLYVEPLYLRAQGQRSIPEMKQIIAAYDEKIVLANSIDEALAKLFNFKNDMESIEEDIDDITQEEMKTIQKAKEIYNKAIDAQKNGNWAEYGEYIKQLGELLENLTKK